MPLHITRADRDARAVLVLTGDLDFATRPALLDAADIDARDIVIDATALAFCDSSGLGAFVHITHQLTRTGGHLAIAGPSGMVRRTLEISGLAEAMIVADSVVEAIAQLDSAGTPSAG